MQFILFYNCSVVLDFGDLSVAPLQNTVHMGVVNTSVGMCFHLIQYYMYYYFIDFNLLTTDDECTRHVTLATCYQLAQSV